MTKGLGKETGKEGSSEVGFQIKVKNTAFALAVCPRDELVISSEPPFPHVQVGLHNYFKHLAVSIKQDGVQ